MIVLLFINKITYQPKNQLPKKESRTKKKNQKERRIFSSERKVSKRKFYQRKFPLKLSIKESGAKKIAPLISLFLSLFSF